MKKEKKRVLHILVEGEYSGAQNVIINIINRLNNEYDFFYSSMHGTVETILLENKITFVPYTKPTYKEFKRVITAINPDIIHAHDFTASVLSSLVAGKIPLISHIHNNPPWIKHICKNTIIYAVASLKFRVILTVSNAIVNEFIFQSIFNKKTTMIGNPIDLSIIKKKAKEKIPEKVEKNAHADIVFLGRLSPQKNIFYLLEILKELKKSIPYLKVSIIGDGELRSEFEEKIYEYQMQDNITLYGFQKNPYPYLKLAKVMCMPSSWEGFGLAAVEALALGLPVVCSNVGGLPGIVTNECGIICNSLTEYVQGLETILLNSKKREQMKEAALARAIELDNINDYTNKIHAIYNFIDDVNKREI